MRRFFWSCIGAVATAAAVAAWQPALAGSPPAAAPERALQPAGDTLVPSALPVRRDRAFADFGLGLYASQRSEGRAAFLSQPGAKRLTATALRETRLDPIGLAMVRAARAVCSADEWLRQVNSFSALGTAFGSRQRFAAGESFTFEWVPGEGVAVLINGTMVSRNVGDAEFFALLARSWMVEPPPPPVKS